MDNFTIGEPSSSYYLVYFVGFCLIACILYSFIKGSQEEASKIRRFGFLASKVPTVIITLISIIVGIPIINSIYKNFISFESSNNSIVIHFLSPWPNKNISPSEIEFIQVIKYRPEKGSTYWNLKIFISKTKYFVSEETLKVNEVINAAKNLQKIAKKPIYWKLYNFETGTLDELNEEQIKNN